MSAKILTIKNTNIVADRSDNPQQTKRMDSAHDVPPLALKVYCPPSEYQRFLKAWKKSTVSRSKNVSYKTKFIKGNDLMLITVHLDCTDKMARAITTMFRPRGYFGKEGFSGNASWVL